MFKTRVTGVAAACVVVAGLLPMVADAQFVRSGEPDVAFTAAGPAGLKFDGKSSQLAVSESANTLTVTVPLAAFKTGIDLRDKHMKEKYLEVQKYPQAELSVARSALKIPAVGQEASQEADGKLSLHGQTHPIKFQYQAKRNGDSFAVHGTMRLNMKDYGIDVPSYLGVTVKPDIDVAVKFDAIDKR